MEVRVVSFHYTLKNKAGETLDSSKGKQPLTYLEDHGGIIPGLEIELKKMNVGDKKHVPVMAADAYGVYDEQLIIEVPASQFPKGHKIEVGQVFSGGDGMPLKVKSIVLDKVTLDGNHELAGEDLFFDVEIVSARPATAEELTHGHVHGEGGHHH